MNVRKRVISLGVVLLLAMLCMGVGPCATVDVQVPNTPTKAFIAASASFENAWDSYHMVWLALPKEDPRKALWLKNYHPKFLAAGKFLERWGTNYADPTRAVEWDTFWSELETVGVTLALEWAIKKGGK
jgi:hypothetical protein